MRIQTMHYLHARIRYTIVKMSSMTYQRSADMSTKHVTTSRDFRTVM